VVDVLHHVAFAQDAADWVCVLYLDKLLFQSGVRSTYLSSLDLEQQERLLDVLEQQPRDSRRTQELLKRMKPFLEDRLQPSAQTPDPTEEQKERIRKLLQRVPDDTPGPVNGGG